MGFVHYYLLIDAKSSMSDVLTLHFIFDLYFWTELCTWSMPIHLLAWIVLEGYVRQMIIAALLWNCVMSATLLLYWIHKMVLILGSVRLMFWCVRCRVYFRRSSVRLYSSCPWLELFILIISIIPTVTLKDA